MAHARRTHDQHGSEDVEGAQQVHGRGEPTNRQAHGKTGPAPRPQHTAKNPSSRYMGSGRTLRNGQTCILPEAPNVQQGTHVQAQHCTNTKQLLPIRKGPTKPPAVPQALKQAMPADLAGPTKKEAGQDLHAAPTTGLSIIACTCRAVMVSCVCIGAPERRMHGPCAGGRNDERDETAHHTPV